MNNNAIRTRWSAIGAAVAITLGAGGIGLVSATSPADAVAYVPIEPCRIADTRPEPAFNVGPRSTPVGQNETHMITAHGDNGDCTGIPTTATGLQLNVTAVDASQNTFVTVWGSGDRPTASSLNPAQGQPPAPNAVTTGLTGTGVFNVYNRFGTIDIIVDVVGYYTDHNHDDRYYTETEVDAAVGTKANSADVYTQTEVDAAVGTKANSADVYTQTQVDAALSDKVTSDDGKSAYAWLCSASQAIGVAFNVTTGCGYSYNPSGSAVTVTRTAVGRYSVSFPGLSMSEGHVQVTAYGNTNNSCKVVNWGSSSVNVRCNTPAGALVDDRFTVLALD